MILLGTIVNCICIILGTLIGKLLHRIPEKVKTTVMHGIGLAVMLLGIQMGLKSEQFLIVIFSLVFGAILGEWWSLDDKLNLLGKWIETRVGSSSNEGTIAKGFVTATLIFVIGAMAIIGSLDSGLRQDHSVLFTKSVIDGFTSLVLATTLGIGVLFSAIPVMIYQGSISLLATQIEKWVPQELMDSFIVEMTGTGGIMIVAIGLNLLGLTKIRVANLLPGILVTAILVVILYYWSNLVDFTQAIISI
ncbi:DUF554 domain-containing protein [Ferdinandcohnia quinoae]|uniref:DUF554 domain-containing protein n=1 Tax=Fredinandcohnia quinoae TaxID=2918902 RepID=A0AAW5EC84_9BACI|nr:DUF554 domain-containing protein [Fredinandcohnia sp. SECRCQ15]MCH1626778.1 DUF554 domain-containing protein [Fredinandcohnia sp. SECRCQ15]